MYLNRSRISQLIKGMNTRSIQTSIITNPIDILYYTGFLPRSWDMSALLVTDSGSTYLIIPYSEFNRKLPNVDEVHVYSDYKISVKEDTIKNFEYVLLDLLKNHEEGIIGYQRYDVPIAFRDFMITKVMPENEVDISEIIWSSRQIKDPSELQNIREASEIAEIGMRAAIEMVTPKKHELDYKIEIEGIIKRAGADPDSVRVNIISGEKTSKSYTNSTTKIIMNSDIVIIDIIMSKNHYFSRLTRTLHMGEPTKEQIQAFSILNKAISRVEEEITLENQIKELDLRIRKILSTYGLDEKVTHRVGNSIGLEYIERPFIDSEANERFKENMVLILDPVIHLNDFGIRISDMLRVTEDGLEKLTKLDKEIFVL